MSNLEILEELHSNIRRTRVTYRALVDGKQAAIKCYRKPLWGFIHWLKAVRRGKQIRLAGGPVPAIEFSGWIGSEHCFGFGTAFLEGFRPLRDILREEPSLPEQKRILGTLGMAIEDLHSRGIEQTDGNLTNFMMNNEHQIALIDEDDVRVHCQRLNKTSAQENLANIAARLPSKELVIALLEGYLSQSIHDASGNWSDQIFWEKVNLCKTQLQKRRKKRNVPIDRYFD